MKEMAVALLPIIAIFYIFQIFSLRLSKREVARITIGVAYTYVGLVLFLTGVNVASLRSARCSAQSSPKAI